METSVQEEDAVYLLIPLKWLVDRTGKSLASFSHVPTNTAEPAQGLSSFAASIGQE